MVLAPLTRPQPAILNHLAAYEGWSEIPSTDWVTMHGCRRRSDCSRFPARSASPRSRRCTSRPFRLYLGLLGLAWTIRWLIHVHLGYLAPPKSAIRALCISEGLIAFAWLTLPWLPVKYYPPEVVVMLVLLLLGCWR